VGDPQGWRGGDEVDERELIHEVVQEFAVVNEMSLGDVQRIVNVAGGFRLKQAAERDAR
jgi:hypothetical protein